MTDCHETCAWPDDTDSLKAPSSRQSRGSKSCPILPLAKTSWLKTKIHLHFVANMPDMPSKSVSLRALNLEPPSGHLLARLRTRSLWAGMKRSMLAHLPSTVTFDWHDSAWSFCRHGFGHFESFLPRLVAYPTYRFSSTYAFARTIMSADEIQPIQRQVQRVAVRVEDVKSQMPEQPRDAWVLGYPRIVLFQNGLGWHF